MGRLKPPERPKPWKSSGLKKGSNVGDGLEVRSFLGKGAFGAVYRVKRQADGQNYALKIVDIRTRSQRGKQSAVNEIRVLAAVESEFVIRFWEAFVEREQLHIVTEFAQGSDLARKFEQLSLLEQRLPETTVWSYFAQLCLGLQALHSVNILHRDLKPANVLLVSDDRLKIGDLGIAKVLNGDEPVAKTQCGTPAYFSPELWRNQPYDDRSDVWALGCILYEMVMMKLPFYKAKHVLWGVFSPPDHTNDELNNLIKQILVVNSKDRPDVNGLLKHDRVAALVSTLLPDAPVETHPDTEGALGATEDKDAAPMIGRIKVPRQKKALAGRDWLPSPRYAAASSEPASDEAVSASIPAGQSGRPGWGTLGGTMAGQHHSSRQEERLVPLPIPTLNEQAALRERFAAYARQQQSPHRNDHHHQQQRQSQHHGHRNCTIERPSNEAQAFVRATSPRNYSLHARGNVFPGEESARAEHPKTLDENLGTTTVNQRDGNLPGRERLNLSARVLQARPDPRETVAVRARMSLTKPALRLSTSVPPKMSRGITGASPAGAKPSSAREWLDSHQLTDQTRPTLHDADLQTQLTTTSMHTQVHGMQGRSSSRNMDTLGTPRRVPQGEHTADLALARPSVRSGSFPRSSGFGAFVMV